MNTGYDPTELLLKQYEHESSFFLFNEESGEKRVTFLWTLAAALVGGFAVLCTTEKITEKHESINIVLLIGLAATLIVLLFGWLTLERIITRNTRTDEHKLHLYKIQMFFVDQCKDEALRAQLTKSLPYPERPKARPPLKPGTGGYAQTTVLLNSVLTGLCAGLAAMLIFHGLGLELIGMKWDAGVEFSHFVFCLPFAVVAALVSWRRQICFVNERIRTANVALKLT